jgi:hypothetical protein
VLDNLKILCTGLVYYVWPEVVCGGMGENGGYGLLPLFGALQSCRRLWGLREEGRVY